MLGDRVEFEGTSGEAGRVPDAAQISVSSGEQYVYVEVIKGVVQVWSGPACRKCQRVEEKLLRCPMHHGVLIVAEQLGFSELV